MALVLWFSNLLAEKLFAGKIHGYAIALVVGLTLAYVGGLLTDGDKGLSDTTMFLGLGILGGAMFRDLRLSLLPMEPNWRH